MPLPNFFVIGAAKAGTTALYEALGQHPDVFMPPRKEPAYFAAELRQPQELPVAKRYLSSVPAWIPRMGSLDARWYLAQFLGARCETAIGDASTVYLDSAEAPAAISRNVPEARIVALLRDPVDRAYSAYWFLVDRGIEHAPTFEAALALEQPRAAHRLPRDLQYRRRGCYHTHLSRWYRLFDAEQIRVYLYEDWRRQPRALLRDLFAFLDIDPDFQPELRESNVGLAPRRRALHRLAMRTRLPGVGWLDRRYNRAAPPPMRANTRRDLREDFREEVAKLQALIGRDLSHWLGDQAATRELACPR